MASQGTLDKMQEYWIERMVGDIKDLVHGNATHNSDVTAVKVLLCRMAARKCR